MDSHLQHRREGEAVFRAEANCNLHGGGDDKATVSVDGDNGDAGGGATPYLVVAMVIPILIVAIVLLRRK